MFFLLGLVSVLRQEAEQVGVVRAGQYAVAIQGIISDGVGESGSGLIAGICSDGIIGLHTYFYFLKSKEQYAVMRPANFVRRLPMIGASGKCTEKCTWDNYRLFLSILDEVKEYLWEVSFFDGLIMLYWFCE